MRLIHKNSRIREDLLSIVNYFFKRNKPKIEHDIEPTGIIVPTTCCNARCVFCSYRLMKDARKIMNFETFKKAVKIFKELNSKEKNKICEIDMTPTVGDSMLDPGFQVKVKYLIKNTDFKISLVTNGIALDREKMKFLTENQLNTISFDFADFDPVKDSEVYGITPEISKKRMKNILEYLKNIDKKKKGAVFILFRGVSSPRKIMKDMKKTPFYNFYKKGLFKIQFLEAYDNWGGTIKQRDLIGYQQIKTAPKVKKYPCKFMYRLSIMPDGDIRSCGCRMKTTLKDELVIGNVNNGETISKIFIKGKHRKILSDWVEKGELPDVCKNCTFYKPNI